MNGMRGWAGGGRRWCARQRDYLAMESFVQSTARLRRNKEVGWEEVCILPTIARSKNRRDIVEHTARRERNAHVRALNEFCTRIMRQTRISGGRSSLTASTTSGTSGISVINFMDTRFPAACTPASVRAARPRLTFVGLSALSDDTAPTRTSASNNTPSIVRASGWLRAAFCQYWGVLQKTEERKH